MRKTEKITYFPFAPGVPYRIRGGMYVVPYLDSVSWDKAFENKKVTVVCHQGFLETLMASTILEAVSQLKPSKSLEWISNPFTKDVFLINGLGSESIHNISQDVLYKYPVPLFFNSNADTAYLNCLNNYLDVYTYYGEKRYHDSKPASQQVFRNLMVGWSHNYLPKMRKVRCTDEMEMLARAQRFNLEKQFILVIPDSTGLSDHDDMALNWRTNEVRSFASMLRGTNYELVILTPNPQKYFGIRALIPPFKIEYILFFLSKASVVLSKEVDFTIGSLLLGNAKTFSLRTSNEFRLEKNKNFLGVENEIVTSKNLSPYYIFQELL